MYKSAASSYSTETRICSGVGAEPSAEGEPPSEDVVVPGYPKYEGLGYKSSATMPGEAADLSFPPSAAAKPAVAGPVSA